MGRAIWAQCHLDAPPVDLRGAFEAFARVFSDLGSLLVCLEHKSMEKAFSAHHQLWLEAFMD